MNSADQLKAIVGIWIVFGLAVLGISFTNGTQWEDVLLTAVLGVIVLITSALVIGFDFRTLRSRG
jgi:hypothetical protein